MEEDLYGILGVHKTASKSEVKKAYHKAALASHPDKVAEHERETAEIRFKSVSQAYEILYDEDTRHLYDTHGMAAFEKGSGPGGPGDVDINELFEQMFSGGGHPAFGGGGGPGPGFFFDPSQMGGGGGGVGRQRKRPKGQDEEKEHEVSLEELYKGKTIKFASTKNVVCSHCKGLGGKEKAKTTTCSTCRGAGMVKSLVSLGNGLMTQQTHECGSCHGTGQVYKDKDKCKKCKGERVVAQKKFLELYIPPGARDGEKVVLHNEADQGPDDLEPGDLVFVLSQDPHAVFTRRGNDLSAEITVTLSEALTGFERVVIQHLDGRGIQLKVRQPKGKILRPGQVLKVPGEGMPIKKTDHRGDLYLIIKVEFPADGWVKSKVEIETLRQALPGSGPTIKSDIIDDVEFQEGSLEEFGGEEAGQDEEWEDEDGQQGPQCATQ